MYAYTYSHVEFDLFICVQVPTLHAVLYPELPRRRQKSQEGLRTRTHTHAPTQTRKHASTCAHTHERENEKKNAIRSIRNIQIQNTSCAAAHCNNLQHTALHCNTHIQDTPRATYIHYPHQPTVHTHIYAHIHTHTHTYTNAHTHTNVETKSQFLLAMWL